MKRIYILLNLFALAALLTTGYIFANSFQFSEGSNERSEQMSQQIQQIVQSDHVDKELTELNVFVRKAAHGLEFATLGINVAGFFLCFSRRKN